LLLIERVSDGGIKGLGIKVGEPEGATKDKDSLGGKRAKLHIIG